MWGTAARTIRIVLNSNRSAASCHAASSNEMARPAGGPPEFVIRPSIPPNLSAVAAIHLSIASRDRTSTGMANTVDPVPRSIREAADVIDDWSRDEIETIAPSCARTCATAYPSPLLAPAISMTLFLSCRSIQPLMKVGSRTPDDPGPGTIQLFRRFRLHPPHDAIERFARGLIECRAGRPRRRTRKRAAAMEHFLADRHPDPFLKLEAHQRYSAVERLGSLFHAAAAEKLHDLNEYLGKRKAGHGSGRSGQKLLEQEHTAEAAKDAHRRVSGRFDDA